VGGFSERKKEEKGKREGGLHCRKREGEKNRTMMRTFATKGTGEGWKYIFRARGNREEASVGVGVGGGLMWKPLLKQK